jgi:cytochrome P450
MIEDLLVKVSPKTLAIGIVGVWGVIWLSRRIAEERKIRALGGHTSRIRTWAPYGLFSFHYLFCNLATANKWRLMKDIDLIIRAIRDTMAHRNMEGWLRWFYAATKWTVEAVPGGRRVVFTADPENIKAILATQFNDYGKGKPFHDEWKDFLGDSIFTTDLDMWHNSRQLIRPQFIKDRVSDLGIFEEHVQILIKQIKLKGLMPDGRQGKELEVSDLFFRYTLDAATHFLLGRSVDSLEIQEQEFAEAFSEAQRIQNIITRAGYVFYVVYVLLY